MFTIVFIVFLVHLTLICVVIGDPVRSHLFAHEQVMESFSSFPSTVPSFEDDFTHNMWNPHVGAVIPRAGYRAFSIPLVMNLTWPRSHSLVILLQICPATKKVRVILHDVLSGTTATPVTSRHLNFWYLEHSYSSE